MRMHLILIGMRSLFIHVHIRDPQNMQVVIWGLGYNLIYPFHKHFNIHVIPTAEFGKNNYQYSNGILKRKYPPKTGPSLPMYWPSTCIFLVSGHQLFYQPP